MKRVSVVGNAGSGKTRVAAEVARRLGVSHVELDAVFHRPGWTDLPTDEFRERVDALASEPRWVIDGNYGDRVQDLVWARADTVVWLDLPRVIVMRRIIGRTLGRVVLRRELWNGNRERWQNLFTRDPLRSVVAWAWTQHGAYRARYEHAMHDPTCAHLRFVRLRSAREIETFLRSIEGR